MTETQSSDAPARRVGRPSVAAERRDQIFDAVERCLIEVGLANTTLDAIAERAGMTRSAIAHFVGNREAVIDAAVAHSVGWFVALAKSTVEDVDPPERIHRYLDFVLAANPRKSELIVVLDEVVAHAHHDDHARDQLRQGYVELEEFCRQMLADRFPDAEPARRNAVANSVVLLLREFDRVRSLGATDKPMSLRRQVRETAESLIASLEE